MMATYVTVTVRGCEGAALEAALRESFDEMQRLADQLSEWDPQSPVSQVSAEAGVRPVPVPPELFEVLVAAKAASRLTGGAFDVTWAALAGLWRFDEVAPTLPAAAAVRQQLALVGDADLRLDVAARTAFLRRRGMRLGLGGLAKGYIAQAGADRLNASGFRDVLVAASGDITARGSNAERPWRVAIQDPRRPGAVVGHVELHDESISTAGDYEHAFMVAGRRYHHILNPKTGWPADGAASVSVLSARGVWSDALDTGLLVMGSQAGAALADQTPAIGALFVDRQGRVQRAGPLGDRFVIEAAAAPRRPDTRQ